MVYKSKRPTKEKERLFKFMERHKVSGTVSGKKLGRYIQQKRWKLEARGKEGFGIKSKSGAELMRGGMHEKKPRIRMWYIP